MSSTVERIRAFNRAWTEQLGLLGRGLLDTEHSLAEARVLFELAQRRDWEQLELRRRLGIDASFLTRVLNRLRRQGLVEASRSVADGRRRRVRLTAAGRKAAKLLDRRSSKQIEQLIGPLSPRQQGELVEAMTVISALLRPGRGERTVAVRELEIGDLGWVIDRHGVVYADEFGWDQDFEGLVARIVADYYADHRPGSENAWIAEVDGARAGCVFCCRRDEETAQLRILLVEPWARGLGIGRRLVDTCIAFARDAGYPRMMLWTNDVLVSARRIYEAAGFQLVESEPHHSFGHDLVGQNWELDLTSPARNS
jgi:DNA-binding MarR family transcriptional regulator/GNAT superfamily N-acetyltransferase